MHYLYCEDKDDLGLEEGETKKRWMYKIDEYHVVSRSKLKMSLIYAMGVLRHE
jgi:hypothetical protein